MNTTTTQTKVSKPQEGKRDEYGMTAANWKRLNAMTEEDVLAAARSEPNALPTEDYPPGRLGPPRARHRSCFRDSCESHSPP